VDAWDLGLWTLGIWGLGTLRFPELQVKSLLLTGYEVVNFFVTPFWSFRLVHSRFWVRTRSGLGFGVWRLGSGFEVKGLEVGQRYNTV